MSSWKDESSGAPIWSGAARCFSFSAPQPQCIRAVIYLIGFPHSGRDAKRVALIEPSRSIELPCRRHPVCRDQGGSISYFPPAPSSPHERIKLTELYLMLFFQLVRREMRGSLNWLLIMFGVGGISIASILAAINAGAHAADSGKPNLWAATLFIVALLLFIKTHNLNPVSTMIQAIIRRMRVRLMDQVRHSELLALIPPAGLGLVAAITKETAALDTSGQCACVRSAGFNLGSRRCRVFVAFSLCAERHQSIEQPVFPFGYLVRRLGEPTVP